MSDETINLLAVLYADVPGSTRLYENFDNDISRVDVKVCINLLTKITLDWDGKVIKTIDDEVMCAFLYPFKTVNAAKEMHQVLREASEAGQFQYGKVMVKTG